MQRSPLPRMSAKRLAEMKEKTWKPKPRKPLKRSRMSKKRKATGELSFFLDLYEENKDSWISQISGADLIHPEFDEKGKLSNGEYFCRQFSHILPKGTYPDLRKEPGNIVFKTAEEHRRWEEEKQSLKAYPEWSWVFEKELNLKRQLYG